MREEFSIAEELIEVEVEVEGLGSIVLEFK
jgi:hypothetical protein